MLEFLCYFMPSFISIKIYNHISNKRLSKESIIFYGIFTVINNLLSLSIFFIINHNLILSFSKIGLTFSFEYLAISFVFSLVTPFIVSIIEKNIRLRIEVKENEKNKKNK